jgi:hypothetical protein
MPVSARLKMKLFKITHNFHDAIVKKFRNASGIFCGLMMRPLPAIDSPSIRIKLQMTFQGTKCADYCQNDGEKFFPRSISS